MDWTATHKMLVATLLATSYTLNAPSLLRSTPRNTPIYACAPPPEIERFHDWLKANGVTMEKVRGERLPEFGLSLVAPDGCEEGDTLLTVPALLHITPAKVKETAVGQAVDGVIPADDESAFLALGLLAEFSRGGDGPFWPYLDILPGADDMIGQPLLWSEDELAMHFSGSHLQSTIGAVKSGLIQQWQAIEERVVPNHPNVFPPEVFNLQGYLYAHAIVLTRALPFGEELSLIPFLDLANHQKGASNTCSIGVAKSDGEGIAPVVDASQIKDLGAGEQVAAVLTASKPLAKGEQTFIDYGEAGWRSSWEMLYTYGFVPGSSPDEWCATGGRPIFFESGVETSDPLINQKRAILVTLGAAEEALEGTWLDLQPRVDVAMSMAPLLRLATLSDDGTEPLATDMANWKADPKQVWSRLQTPLSDATEAKVAARVLATCGAALEELPPAEKLAPAAVDQSGDGVEAERARLAARVLLGERAALEACQSVWEKVAEKAEEAKEAAA